MKLYIFQHNGIVKIGITKHDDTNIRLAQINSNLPKDKQFEFVCDFEVSDNAAMIERLIHEYLGINQLNVQYLKNQMVLVNVDFLHSREEGYTEFFMADKDKVKQAIILFGILDYITVTPEQLKKLDSIKGYSFDFFADKYPKFLKLCEPINKLKQTTQQNNQNSLINVIKNLENDKIYADFFIENNQFYLTLNNHKVNIEDLTEKDNVENIKNLLSNKNITSEKKEIKILYSIIRELRANNKETSLQPLTSMQKELKENEFYEFMEKSDGYKKVKKILEPWFVDGIHAEELLGLESTYYNAIIETLIDNDLSPKQRKKLEQQKILLENKEITKPNFNSPFIFPQYIDIINKDDCFFKYYPEHNNIYQSVNMVASIYKILYNSKNKEEELEKIEKLLDYVDDFYKYIYEPNYKSRNNKNLEQLTKCILELMTDKNYIALVESEIKIYGLSNHSNKVEQRAINKLIMKF